METDRAVSDQVAPLRSATTQATWLGSPPGSFGHLHVPAGGQALGAALVVPPIAYEYVCAHRTLRLLAERLADAGVVTLRLDPPGVGDASGWTGDPGLVAAWQAAVEQGARYLRTMTRGPVLGIGMRIGALLVGAGAPSFDATVLWDPVASGRRWVREARALRGVALGASASTASDRLDVAGAVYDGSVAVALSSLRLPGASDNPSLVLVRPDRPDTTLTDALRGWPRHELSDAVGQDRLLDVQSSTALVPRETLERICTWAASVVGPERTPLVVPAPVTAAVVEGPAGAVQEQVLTLGPGRLFGVQAEPVGGSPLGTTLLVCLTNAADVHHGPGRAWVDWGRSMAAKGWRVLRLDTPGIGDSPTPPGTIDDQPFPTAAVRDLSAAIAEARSGPHERIVVLGMCSGGRLALPVGERVGAAAAVAINAPWHTPEPLLARIHPADPYPDAIARRDRRRVRYRLAALVPDPLQRMASSLGFGPDGARELRRALDEGRRVLFVYGATSFNLSRARSTMHWGLHMLERGEGSGLVVIDDLDHAVLVPEPRAAALGAIESYLDAWTAGWAAVPTSPAAG